MCDNYARRALTDLIWNGNDTTEAVKIKVSR
jgi:hypothetical protein